MDLEDPMEFKLDLTRTEANVLNARSIAALKRFPPLLWRVIRDRGRFVDRGSLAIMVFPFYDLSIDPKSMNTGLVTYTKIPTILRDDFPI